MATHFYFLSSDIFTPFYFLLFHSFFKVRFRYPSTFLSQTGRQPLCLFNMPLRPSSPLDAQLDSSEPPVLAVIMAILCQARAGLRLQVVEHGEDAEDDGDAEVEADAHEPLRHGVGDVLEVHGFALDQHADGDDGVEGLVVRGGGGGGGEVGGRGAEEVAGGGPAAAGVLDLRGCVHPVCGERGRVRTRMGEGSRSRSRTSRKLRSWGFGLPSDGNGKLPRPGHRLHDDVRLLDAAGEQLILGALDQRLDDGAVPARVHDADAQAAAVVLLRRGALE